MIHGVLGIWLVIVYMKIGQCIKSLKDHFVFKFTKPGKNIRQYWFLMRVFYCRLPDRHYCFAFHRNYFESSVPVNFAATQIGLPIGIGVYIGFI